MSKFTKDLRVVAYNIEIIGIRCFGEQFRNIEKYLDALGIIDEKGLPLTEKYMINHSENYEQYCIKYSWCKMKNASIQKTEEEFKILKEVL